MKLLFYGLITCILLQLYSCKKNEGKIPYLSEKEMINMFVDIHLVDNMLDVNRQQLGKKHIFSDYYNSVFYKYNISHTEFDSCLTYFAHNPKEYKRIYISVIDSLEKLKNLVYSEKKLPAESSINKKVIWSLNELRKFSGLSRNYLSFKVKVLGKGTYNINAKIKINKDDLSINPMMKVYFSTEGKDEKVEDLKKQIRLRKDGKLHQYQLKIALSDLRFTHVEGYFFIANNSSEYYQDFEIKEAHVFYSSDF